MLAKRWNNYVENMFGKKPKETKDLKVKVIDKMYLGPDEFLPFVLYFEDLEPEKEHATRHVMVVRAGEQDISLMEWFEFGIGTKWEVRLGTVRGMLRLIGCCWKVREP